MLEKIKAGLVIGVMAMGLTACGGDSMESMMEDNIEQIEKATAVLKDIKSKDDATSAADDLKSIKAKMNELKEKGKKLDKEMKESMKDMSKEKKAELRKSGQAMYKKMSEAQSKMSDEMIRINKVDSEAGKIVREALK